MVFADSAYLDLALLAILGSAAVLMVLAYRMKIPYPILLVVGGAGIGFIPGLPQVDLAPEAVLVIFLPPLLYSAAFFSSLRDLRDNVRPIGLLAVGLVICTTLGVGVVAHAVVDDLSWAAAFTLGAIVAPTDPVAATAIAARSGAPRRLVTILEGESLVNDATALVAYKVALAAVLTGTFSLMDAGTSFLIAPLAGVAIGIAVGAVVARVRRVIDHAPTEITISLITPYFAYLPAEALGVSAVLAAVTSGIWLGWRAPRLITSETRIQLYSVWEILTFVLNAALFLLVGLQLPGILARISDDYPTGQLVGWAALVAGAVIAVRFLWVFPATYLPRWLSPRLRERDPVPGVGAIVVIAWVGMRGAVSLAAALALPAAPEFPGRDLVVFLVYGVILVSLLLEGATLAPLIRVFGLHDDGKLDRVEVKARIKAARAAMVRIDELVEEEWVRDETAERMRAFHEFRIRRFKARFDDQDDGAIDERSVAYQHLQRMVLDAQREEIIRLRNERMINDEVLRRIEHDLDLEDARLEIPRTDAPPPAPAPAPAD
jgi:CPA1 family monovalent cation:H+ antiporter